jgi:hypothetical protein
VCQAQPSARLRRRKRSAAHPELAAVSRVLITQQQLLSEIASGYDWLVLGEDKWNQIAEPHWYDDELARDQALASLPRVALAPRPGPPSRHGPASLDDRLGLVLQIDPALARVSSTSVRAGRDDWAAPVQRPSVGGV